MEIPPKEKMVIFFQKNIGRACNCYLNRTHLLVDTNCNGDVTNNDTNESLSNENATNNVNKSTTNTMKAPCQVGI